jgi:hypothetical protein
MSFLAIVPPGLRCVILRAGMIPILSESIPMIGMVEIDPKDGKVVSPNSSSMAPAPERVNSIFPLSPYYIFGVPSVAFPITRWRKTCNEVHSPSRISFCTLTHKKGNCHALDNRRCTGRPLAPGPHNLLHHGRFHPHSTGPSHYRHPV